MANIFPVVVTYSFDEDTPVYLFDNEKDALAEIKKQYEEEIYLAENENDHKRGLDMEATISDDGYYACIKIFGNDYTDVMEWRLGDVKKSNIKEDKPDYLVRIVNSEADYESFDTFNSFNDAVDSIKKMIVERCEDMEVNSDEFVDCSNELSATGEVNVLGERYIIVKR